MLAIQNKDIPTGGIFLYEVKWDGIRALIGMNKEKIKIISSSGSDITMSFPELYNMDYIEVEQAVLDDVLVVLDKKGATF